MNKLENFSFDLDDEPNLPVQDEIEQQDTEVEDQDDLELDDPQEDSQEQDTEQTDGKDPLAQATYEKYVELGILEPDESFDGTFVSLEERMEDVPTKLLNQALLELPEQGRAVLQFISAGGSNITKEEIINFVKAWEEENRTSFELEDEARNYLAETLKKQGYKRSAIEAQLNELEDDGELLVEANKLLAEENTKTQKLIESKKAQTEQNKQSERQYYSAINEELKALNYSKRKTEDIQKTLNNANKVLSNIYAKPKAVVQLMDLLTKFNGEEFDLSDFEKQGTTKAVSTIQAALNKSGQNSAGTKTSSTTVSKVLSNPNRFEFTVD